MTTKLQRVHLCLPTELVKRVDEYSNHNMIPTRTGAIMELVRKGLKMEE